MAGFEGPRDGGDDETAATRLPSWAVTRKSTDDEPASEGDGARVARAEPPVVQEPAHPFDVDDPFGDNRLGGGASPWVRPPADDSEVRVVDLADEFHLTTAQALEICEAFGAAVTSGAAWLTEDQAAQFRQAVSRYDRSPSADESFPDWAIPPGGGRPPSFDVPAAGPSASAAPAGQVPPTLAYAPRPAAPEPDPPGSSTWWRPGTWSTGTKVRLALVLVLLLIIAGLTIAMELT